MKEQRGKTRKIGSYALLLYLIASPPLAAASSSISSPFAQWLSKKVIGVEAIGTPDSTNSSDTHFHELVSAVVRTRTAIPENPQAAIARLADEYCSSLGGHWVLGPYAGRSNWGACESNDRDLFAVSITVLPLGNQRETKFLVNIAEAKANQWNAAPYRAALNTLGRYSAEERRRADQLQAPEIARQNDARVAREKIEAAERAAAFAEARPPKLLIGARLCHNDGAYTWVGFTERYSAETQKIQIRVVGTTFQFQPAGWSPQIIWDNPDNWRLCE